MSTLVPRRGPGLVLLSGALAALTGSVGILAVGIMSTGGLSTGLLETAVVWPVGLGLPVAIAAAAAGIVTGVRKAPGALVPVAGCVVAIVAATAALTAPSVIAPWAVSAPAGTDLQRERDVEVLAYVETHDRAAARYDSATEEAYRLLEGAQADPLRTAGRLSQGPVADLASLHDEMGDVRPNDREAQRLHRHLIAVIDVQRRLLLTIAEALRTNDPALTERIQQLQADREALLAELTSRREALLQRIRAMAGD